MTEVLTKDLSKAKTGRYTVTPEMAELALQHNEENRPISKREIEKMSRIHGNGEGFVFNGEAIKFDKTGKLRDGQHRLTTIVKTGKPMDLLVVTGLDEKVFTTLDQGRKRSGGDVLFIRGIKRFNAVAAGASTFYRIIRNRPIFGSVDPIPAYGVDEIVSRHPGIERSVEFVAPLQAQGEKGIMGIGYVAAFHYMIAEVLKEPAKADSLVEGLYLGTGLEEGDPVLQFRRRILTATKRKNIMQAQAKLALFTKVVGMYLSGHRVLQLTVPKTSETFYDLLPTLKESVENMEEELAFADLAY